MTPVWMWIAMKTTPKRPSPSFFPQDEVAEGGALAETGTGEVADGVEGERGKGLLSLESGDGGGGLPLVGRHCSFFPGVFSPAVLFALELDGRESQIRCRLPDRRH
jgi:hypothetical protein